MRVHAHPGRPRRRPAVVRSTSIVVIMWAASACASQTDGSASPMTVSTVTATVTVTQTVGGTSPDSSNDAQSSAPTITPRQKNPEPCKLLTRAEADTLTGMALQAGVGAGMENGAQTLCTYTRDPDASGIAQVSIGVGDGVEKTLEIDRDNLKHKFVKVPGIADEVWQEDGTVFIRKGTVWVEIGLVLLNDPAENVKPLLQAAKIVASRF